MLHLGNNYHKLIHNIESQISVGAQVTIPIYPIDFNFDEYNEYFTNTNDKLTTTDVIVAIDEIEDCDCGDKIMHHNGGNYHFAYGKVVEVF